jgi:hypothetical protein
MKIVKIVGGTILAMWTVGVAIHAVPALMGLIAKGYSPRGLSEAAAAFAAMCMMSTFTIWTFQSAFRKKLSDKDGSDNQSENGKG